MDIFLASGALTVTEGDGNAVVVVKRTGDLSANAIVNCYTADGKMIMLNCRQSAHSAHTCRQAAHGAHKCDYKIRLELV